MPDILVTRFDLVDDGARLPTADVVLAIEVVSPGSRSTDRVLKVTEYPRAGTGSYWIVDLDTTVVTVLEADAGTYITRSKGATVDVTRPAPPRFHLAEILARR